jgi:dTMP kinase
VNRGQLIVFEGIDGCGKSTQIERLARYLRSNGVDVVATREPTDGGYGRKIRELARSGGDVPHSEELRWFVEDRREHVASVIEPALAAGQLVLCDRYFLSTVAYQGARGSDPRELLAVSEAEFPLPDLVVLFEVPVESGLERVHDRGGAVETHFEETAYLERVDAIFRGIERDYIVRVDGRPELAEVERSVSACVARRLGLPIA